MCKILVKRLFIYQITTTTTTTTTTTAAAVAAIFTALHVMQTRYSEENSVCLSVCPSVRLSVTRAIPDKTEERSVQIFTPYERTFILVY